MPHSNEYIKKEYFDLIRNNINLSPAEFSLQYSKNKDLPHKYLAEQLDCLQRAIKKIPTLSKYNLLYNKTSLEQSSSELTAKFKSEQINGKKILDMTGGLGIDSIYFSKIFTDVHYCEISSKLCEIAKYNFSTLEIKNISIHNTDSLEYLETVDDKFFDWIYVDPARRDKSKRSVDINYMVPPIHKNLKLLKKKSKNILIKLSPAFDKTEAFRIFEGISKFQIISLNNELKEVLIYIKEDDKSGVKEAVILRKGTPNKIISNSEEQNKENIVSNIEGFSYLFNPDKSVVKLGLVNQLYAEYDLFKISKDSNFLLSDKKNDSLPGTLYKIISINSFSNKRLIKFCKEEKLKKANIVSSDFPLTPLMLAKIGKLIMGGKDYLFFTKNSLDEKIFIHSKIEE